MAELAEKAEVAQAAAPVAPGRLPGPGPLLAGQVRYQALLLLRSPRAMWAGVLLPVMLLVLTNIQHASVAASALASRAVLGVTLTAYLTHAATVLLAIASGAVTVAAIRPAK